MATLLRTLYPLRRNTSGDGVRIALKLLRFLKANQATTHISLQLVRQLEPSAHDGHLDSTIVKTLQYLAGDGVQILEIGFELIEDLGSDIVPIDLSIDEVREARKSSVNPVTGELDPDIKDKIFVYYKPTSRAISYPQSRKGDDR